MPAQCFGRLVQAIEHLTRDPLQPFSRQGQVYPAVAADEELDPQSSLELGNGSANRPMGQVQLFGGAREALMTGSRFEGW
ncbi:hypothetical protein GCM10008997_12670 [Halomonas salifodinae]